MLDLAWRYEYDLHTRDGLRGQYAARAFCLANIGHDSGLEMETRFSQPQYHGHHYYATKKRKPLIEESIPLKTRKEIMKPSAGPKITQP